MKEDVNETARRLTETHDVQDDLLIVMAQRIVRSLRQSYFRRRHRVAGCLLDSARRVIGGLSTYAGS